MVGCRHNGWWRWNLRCNRIYEAKNYVLNLKIDFFSLSFSLHPRLLYIPNQPQADVCGSRNDKYINLMQHACSVDGFTTLYLGDETRWIGRRALGLDGGGFLRFTSWQFTSDGLTSFHVLRKKHRHRVQHCHWRRWTNCDNFGHFHVLQSPGANFCRHLQYIFD